MKTKRLMCILAVLGALQGGQAQPLPFLNLDFEAAYLPTIPRGEYGTWVPISHGLPGWSAFLGNEPITQVLHNNVTLGSPAVLIWGPDWPYGLGGRIEGNFTPVLLAGATTPISISQTGLVPPEGVWLLFKGLTYPVLADVFSVSLNGQPVPVSAFATYPEYCLYRADVSAFAGTEAELRFTVFAGRGWALKLDSIEFSPVPEPGTIGLLLLGLAVCALASHWRRRKPRPSWPGDFRPWVGQVPADL